MEILVFYAIAIEPIEVQKCSAPQNDRLDLSFLEDIYVYAKKMARKNLKIVIYEQQILGLTLYVVKGHFNPGLFNPRLFNHELFNTTVQKIMVEKSEVEKFIVDKSGVERSGVGTWG